MSESVQAETPDFRVPMNENSNVRKVIGVVSGKGGVGKSFVTSYLSVLLTRRGLKTAILDADITGPSIPKAFGIHEKATGGEMGIYPAETGSGIELISANMLLETEETPVIWRGAMIANTVKQFWSEVLWGEVDVMLVDMPPGTGDVPLTVFQSLPVDGILIVTSPQELVSMIVSKAVAMAKEMDIPVLGLIENYSYVECPHCGEKIYPFGQSHVDEVADKYGIPVLGRIPLDPEISAKVDAGETETVTGTWLDQAADCVENCQAKTVPEGTRIAIPVGEDGKVFTHYGKAEQFLVYTVKDGIMTSKESVRVSAGKDAAQTGDNMAGDGTGCGQQARCDRLKEAKVHVVVCAQIGEGAQAALEEAGMEVVPGASGHADVAFALYLAGAYKNKEKA